MSGKNADAHGVEGSETGVENEPLPFVAPCHDLAVSAPFEWLKGGWEDYRNAPGLSLETGWLGLAAQHAVGFYFCGAVVGIRFVLGQQAIVPGQQAHIETDADCSAKTFFQCTGFRDHTAGDFPALGKGGKHGACIFPIQRQGRTG